MKYYIMLIGVEIYMLFGVEILC